MVLEGRRPFSSTSLVRLAKVVKAVLLAAAAAATAQAATPRYEVVDLQGVPQRLNESGQIAGWIYVGADAHAAIYTGGAWRDLGVPAADQLSAAFGINNAGAVVGFSFVALPGPDNRWQAIWVPAGALAAQPLAPLAPDSFNYGINDHDVIVGCRNRYDDTYPDPHRAYVHANGVVTDLHALLVAAGDPYSFTCARDVNLAGDVVGEVQAQYSPQRGFIYRGGSVSLLVQGANYLSSARAINDAGKVVGEGRLVGFSADHAVTYDATTGTIASLGVEATGAYTSRPNDINARGEVVGMMFLGVGERAFLASGTRVVDLNELIPTTSGWVLSEAQSINAAGLIVGRGYRTATPTLTSYFLLKPVAPAPAGLIEAIEALAASGVLGHGSATALVAKLRAAAAQIDKGNVRPAINQLDAFVNEVQALMASGRLTAAHGQPLIDEARRIIASLTG
ncbi:MAG: hypothetical protein JNL30_09785 [Rubrivivax sp.]|nr:hypothetical protein [Rubrivivax sp.]